MRAADSFTMRAGTVLPVAANASGMLFLTYLPEDTAKLTLTTVDERTTGFASVKSAR
jgi:hypothetical protein